MDRPNCVKALESNVRDLTRVIGFALLWTALPAADRTASGYETQPLAARSGPRGSTMFVVQPPTATGVVTENAYADPQMWGERYNEFEVGAIGTGVAIGDYDGDGRPDIFVVSKTETSRLFRNLGDWKFEDVTVNAGVGDRGDDARVWKQGATFADVDNDGQLDLYLCRFGAPNRLYMNQGDGTFREEAAARGLAVVDSSVIGAFCDYDRDGWLDVFVLTNMYDAANHPRGQRSYLFHNNGDGTFNNVTEGAGITGEGQGHSATWWDYDEDGWPDIHVANDFAAADRLYRNNRDGTFTDVIDRVMPHTTLSSMGADLGDVNNDGRIDLFVADMAATTHEKDQRSMANMRVQGRDPEDGVAVAPQYPRNALFLTTGTGRCLEAAFLAGLEATDWTWAARFEDLDNDGRIDLYVTTGMHREAHNADLMRQMMLAESRGEKIRLERQSPVLNEPNLAFRNLGDLQFEKISAAWGLDQRGVSFGAAFGDLDGDGDLDLVYSNYQAGATLLRNDSDSGHRLTVALRGTRSNRSGVGATVRIETAAGVQVRQLVLARGVLSGSEPMLHFGLGDEGRVQRLEVTWPSGVVQTFTDVAADRRLTITEPSEVASGLVEKVAPTALFSEVSQATNLSQLSREIKVDEISQQRLLPQRLNRRGPALVAADLDGLGADDVLVGGTPVDPARVMHASASGRFILAAHPLGTTDPTLAHGPLLVFDADGDGRNEVLTTTGGTALPLGEGYQPRLYRERGDSGWEEMPEALPELPISVGALAAADFDRDGRLDVFMGGRVVPWLYPQSPRSALLANRGGRFEDVTETLVAGLAQVGMVTSALWSDVDDDGWLDLILTVEWGQVKCFHNDRGQGFTEWTEQLAFASAGTGWWSAIAAADFNGDGRPDYVVGNLGLNTPYRADALHPVVLFDGDFKGDGTIQLVEGYYEGDKLYPRRTRRDLGAEIPAILKRYPKHDGYARATLAEIVGEDKLAMAERYAATELRSGVLLSQPDGKYRFEPLPRMAQISPIQGLAAGDFDGDGHADIYAVQNSHAPIPFVGRFDGGLSQLMRGDGSGHFLLVPPLESGLVVPGDAKALVVLDLNEDGWADFLVSRNFNTTLAFQNNGREGYRPLSVRLRGSKGNPSAVGARVTLELADGTVQMAEVQAGSGYYSQSAAACWFGYRSANPPRGLRVRWPDGSATQHSLPPGETTVVISGANVDP